MSVRSVVARYWFPAHVAQVQDLFVKHRSRFSWAVFVIFVFLFRSFLVFSCARVLLRVSSRRVSQWHDPGFRNIAKESNIIW